MADLNADVGGVRLRWSAELARVRERIREADMEGLCSSIFVQWINKVRRWWGGECCKGLLGNALMIRQMRSSLVVVVMLADNNGLPCSASLQIGHSRGCFAGTSLIRTPAYLSQYIDDSVIISKHYSVFIF